VQILICGWKKFIVDSEVRQSRNNLKVSVADDLKGQWGTQE
jgi:hypothetical protein